jgi:hypothetical protein
MAVFPIGPGVPDLSSTGPSGLTVAQIVLPFIQKNNAVSVYYDIAHTDIDTQSGDTFVMSTIQDVTITDDLPIGSKIPRQMLAYPKVELKIDKSADFGIFFDKVQVKQANKEYIGAQSAQAAVNLQNRIDTRVLGSIISDVDPSNTGATAGAQSGLYNLGVSGTPVEFNPSNSIMYLSMCNAVLDEQEAPQEGRFCIINAAMNTALMNSNLKVASHMGTGKESIILGNGRLPWPVANMEIYVNSHLPGATETVGGVSTKCIKPIFGVKGKAFAFGQQMKLFREIEDPDRWGWNEDGKEVFGWEVTNGQNLGYGEVYVNLT